MRVIVGSDHAGKALKDTLITHLRERGLTVDDEGPFDEGSVDYPEYGARVSRRVATDAQTDDVRGLLVCGSGIGMCMAANRIAGIRAAVCESVQTVQMTRSHNDANVLCIGARVVDETVAKSMVDAFIDTPFEGGRHARRVAQLTGLEK